MKLSLSNSTLFAVNAARSNLVELIEEIASGSKKDNIAFLNEAQEILVSFSAAIVERDGQFSELEKDLLKSLIPALENDSVPDQLANCASEWRKLSKRIPDFFHAAIHTDREKGSQRARAILREIQLFGNNIAACDRRFELGEHATVKDYVSRLEQHLAAS